MSARLLAVREMREGEAAGVAQLWADCGLTRPWNDPAGDIAFAMAGPSSTILAGEADGRIAATALVGHDGHRGTVYYVCVHPDFRGCGFGRQIMAAAEDWLRGKGAWKLNLMIRAENTAVEAFYRALGYDVEPRTVMAKWLDESKKPSQR